MKKIISLLSIVKLILSKTGNLIFSAAVPKPGFAEDAKSYYEEGISKAGERNFEEAVKCFDKTIALIPGHYMAWLDRGRSFLELENYQEALANFNQAIKLDPRYYEGWQLRGSAKHYLADYSGALTDYNKSVELMPNETSVYYTDETLDKTDAGGLTVAKQRVSRCDGTSKNTDRAFAIMQDDDSYYKQGYQKELEGKFDEAIKLFDKAIALKPDFFRAHFEKGYCKSMLRYLKAIPAYDPVIR
jgi:tetratricopeptide (TPR) repeat protein